MKFYIDALTKNYANFKGRARRKEYWMFTLGNVIMGLILGLVAGFTEIYFIPFIYSLAVLIPSLAIFVRRMHDIDKSGAWFFVSFIPLLGGIWLLILTCTSGTRGANEYGNNPKGM